LKIAVQQALLCSTAHSLPPTDDLSYQNHFSIIWKCMEGTLECFDTKDKDRRTRWGHVLSCINVHCLPYKLAI